MPTNPYDPDAMRRQAQREQLSGSTAPTNGTMPVGRPAWHVQPAGDMGRLQGFDSKNFSDPAMQSVKYRHGRLAAGVTRPSDMASLVSSEAYQRAFPGATFDGKDKIDFRGALSDGDHGSPVGIIDVLRAADAGQDISEGGWWGFEPDGPMGAGQSPLNGLPPDMLQQDNSTLARIMAELQATRDGSHSPTEREAILNLL